tara:strand:+ start:1682 stop:2092 length:411 start_codon:yes stop_codon:yes gene_type:complete
MKNLISIRELNEQKDIPLLSLWWQHYSGKPLNTLLLPFDKQGLVAVVNKKIIAGVFIFKTNSPVWYCDYLIADPDYKKENRSEIITLLIDKTVEKCFKQGAEGVWCTTPYDKVLNKLKELNYIISKEKHNIIYKTK